MFLLSLQNSANDALVEPIVICNYATFLFRQKKDASQAKRVFRLGLDRFPTHKGLLKNYRLVLKETPPPRRAFPISAL
jgi:hypothetical protein